MRQLFAAVALMFMPSVGHAQTESPATQALSACVERSTTANDNVILTRWIFVAIARHPSVSNLASIPDVARVDANREMGALFNRLLLNDCREETRAAWLADGQAALDVPFRTFGERAMGDIMGHPDVNASIAEMGSYMDHPALAALIEQPVQ